jgi:uncharacterized damage-inducible protein DinB
VTRRGRTGQALDHLARIARFNAWANVLYADFAARRAAREDEDRQLVELVDGLSAEQLAAPVRYRRIIGDGLEEVRAGHVLLNHPTHHRGQVHVLLTQDVLPPPSTCVLFVAELGAAGPPATLAPADS